MRVSDTFLSILTTLIDPSSSKNRWRWSWSHTRAQHDKSKCVHFDSMCTANANNDRMSLWAPPTAWYALRVFESRVLRKAVALLMEIRDFSSDASGYHCYLYHSKQRCFEDAGVRSRKLYTKYTVFTKIGAMFVSPSIGWVTTGKF